MHNLNAPAVSRTVRARSQRLARRLFDTYQPDVLVLENFTYPGSRRSRHLPAVTAAFKAPGQATRHSRDRIHPTGS